MTFCPDMLITTQSLEGEGEGEIEAYSEFHSVKYLVNH
jgi:hypothetical protein